MRRAIGGIDHALVLLLGARARLAVRAGRCKVRAGRPLADPEREARVRQRVEALASRVGLPPSTADGLVALAIADARRVQGIDPAPAAPAHAPPTGSRHAMQSIHLPPQAVAALLRLVPPPRRWAPLLRALPPRLQQRLLERGMAAVLATPVADGSLAFMEGRRLGIDVTDLDLHWVIELRGGRLQAVEGAPEASVGGTATDLLLLAGRLEDADTLFFQRRLVLTGDVELGLTARNTLERLPWESVPLALRIGLNRGARLARAARGART
ncbi:SCP2 sterol-binding domain-containing protein [Luteimonas sp. MC1782]|nr:SCP2 sterol-binding domain-containing protein [Luteimonas sp. MC1895]